MKSEFLQNVHFSLHYLHFIHIKWSEDSVCRPTSIYRLRSLVSYRSVQSIPSQDASVQTCTKWYCLYTSIFYSTTASFSVQSANQIGLPSTSEISNVFSVRVRSKTKVYLYRKLAYQRRIISTPIKQLPKSTYVHSLMKCTRSVTVSLIGTVRSSTVLLHPIAHWSPSQLVCGGPTKPMQGNSRLLFGAIAISFRFCKGYRGCGSFVFKQST